MARPSRSTVSKLAMRIVAAAVSLDRAASATRYPA
jgi:hypothetical protein